MDIIDLPRLYELTLGDAMFQNTEELILESSSLVLSWFDLPNLSKIVFPPYAFQSVTKFTLESTSHFHGMSNRLTFSCFTRNDQFQFC